MYILLKYSRILIIARREIREAKEGGLLPMECLRPAEDEIYTHAKKREE